MAPSALVLFDIDGTLIRRAGPHHKQALITAVRDVCGLEGSLDRTNTAGMLDCDLVRIMLAEARREDAACWLPAIAERAQHLYMRSCPDLRRRVCPGARLALRRLHSAGLRLGLVTGNYSRIGWTKLERAGLARFFRFGAFADQARTRSELVKLAMIDARRAGWLHRDTVVTLVGDHANDIQAAKLNGIRSIAVATGMLSRRELVRHSPDLLLPDLRSLRIEMLL